MLRVRGLSLRYPNGKQALSDFGLTVSAGEFVVVLGGNGSGKTTLLRFSSQRPRWRPPAMPLCA
jgi:ABC-type phosphate/phosphonate transport system ATPase subunit